MSWQPPPSPYRPPSPPKQGMSTGAIVAIVIGGVLVVGVVVMGIVGAIAVPSLLKARSAANESAALGVIRTISSAEAVYVATEGGVAEGGPRYGTLEELARADLVDPGLATSPTRHGYTFTIAVSDDGSDFGAWADPATPGARHFYVGPDGIVRVEEDGPAGPDSAAISQ